MFLLLSAQVESDDITDEDSETPSGTIKSTVLQMATYSRNSKLQQIPREATMVLYEDKAMIL